jgi:hypothetical protein
MSRSPPYLLESALELAGSDDFRQHVVWRRRGIMIETGPWIRERPEREAGGNALRGLPLSRGVTGQDREPRLLGFDDERTALKSDEGTGGESGCYEGVMSVLPRVASYLPSGRVVATRKVGPRG